MATNDAAMEMHRKIKRAQARRFRNRFNPKLDGDARDQAEERAKADRALEEAQQWQR